MLQFFSIISLLSFFSNLYLKKMQEPKKFARSAICYKKDELEWPILRDINLLITTSAAHSKAKVEPSSEIPVISGRRFPFDSEHPSVGRTPNNFSKVYVALGEYLKAIKHYKEALGSRRKDCTNSESRFRAVSRHPIEELMCTIQRCF